MGGCLCRKSNARIAMSTVALMLYILLAKMPLCVIKFFVLEHERNATKNRETNVHQSALDFRPTGCRNLFSEH